MKYLYVVTALIILLFLSSPVGAADYDYYFDTSGSDSNDCTNGTTEACQTLGMAETKANSATSSDTVNLYFGRSNTWTCDTNSLIQGQECFAVNYNEATVNIDSYNSGDGSADPIFDGLVDDFSVEDVSTCAASGTPCRISYFFRFRSPGSISNVEIKDVYGSAIIIDSYSGGSCGGLDCADGFILQDSKIHNIGMEAVTTNANAGAEDCTIQRNEIYKCEQVNENTLCDVAVPNCWGGAIHFMNESGSANGICQNNTVKYNKIYDIYGEGINNPNGTTEYNSIGDTASIAIDLSPHDWDAATSIARYNLIVHSNRSTSIYDNFASSRQDGIRIIDETVGSGDNSSGTYDIYGNVIINSSYGINIDCGSCTSADDFNIVRIYNNLIIDSLNKNIQIDEEDNFDYLYFYNNASILYDRTGNLHTSVITAPGNWDISHNLFWTTGGSPTYDSGDFGTSVEISDPELPGEALSINWDGLSDSDDIDVTLHLYPDSDSTLVGNGTPLESPYVSDFITIEVDFDDVLTGDIGTLVTQTESWSISAVIRGDSYVNPDPTQDYIEGFSFNGFSRN